MFQHSHRLLSIKRHSKDDVITIWEHPPDSPGINHKWLTSSFSSKFCFYQFLPLGSLTQNYYMAPSLLHVACVHSLLIDKDLCECQNISINFPCALLYASFIWRIHFFCKSYHFYSYYWLFGNVTSSSGFAACVYSFVNFHPSDSYLRFFRLTELCRHSQTLVL